VGAVTQNTFVLAIDQGTTSSRAILFDSGGRPVPGAVSQREHRQIFPRAGWVEHDALEIWDGVRTVMGELGGHADVEEGDVAAIGITNQRETVVVWEAATGRPVHNAIVWQDTRTSALCSRLAEGHPEGLERFRATTGLPLSTYFAGPKIRWILDHLDEAGEDGTGRAERGELLAGTMDSWLVWNLTGGRKGTGGTGPSGDPEPALHVTDVTNASRTLLMDLTTLDWDDEACEAIGVPRAMLPRIVPSVGEIGRVPGRRQFGGTPIAGILGDQQAAMFGQTCFDAGEAKNTYGTGAFLLFNTGTERQRSENGMLTTVCYQIDGEEPRYALEGSIAVAGSLVQWLRDNLGLISSADEIEELARSVDDNGDCYFVPAFSGLLAPRWRPDARGCWVGLTGFHGRGHLARAALESTAFQTTEVARAMVADAGTEPEELKVDGGMTVDELLMQFQADLLGVDVVRPVVTETTALGAAFAAGLAVGFWADREELRGLWAEDRRWSPSMDDDERRRLLDGWDRAVARSLDWVAP